MKCQKCSTEFDGDICPNCGEQKKQSPSVKAKKPLYKKWWFWLIIILVVVPVASGLLGSEEEPSMTQESTQTASQDHDTSATDTAGPAEAVYEEVSLTTMCRDLQYNALKADATYTGKKVQFEARITEIDQSGTSIQVEALGETAYTIVDCSTKKKHLDFLMEKKTGERVFIKGTVTSVDSVFGFDIDVDEISNPK